MNTVTRNVIPRKFDKIIATCLSGNCRGEKMIIYKDDRGYHGRDESGKVWSIFPSLLRNTHVFHIEEIIF